MAKRKPYRPGIGPALKAAKRGPFPEYEPQGTLSMKSVRTQHHVGCFPNAKGPTGGRMKPYMPGTDIFQRLKLTTGGPAGTTDPRDF